MTEPQDGPSPAVEPALSPDLQVAQYLRQELAFSQFKVSRISNELDADRLESLDLNLTRNLHEAVRQAGYAMVALEPPYTAPHDEAPGGIRCHVGYAIPQLQLRVVREPETPLALCDCPPDDRRLHSTPAREIPPGEPLGGLPEDSRLPLPKRTPRSMSYYEDHDQLGPCRCESEPPEYGGTDV